MTGYIFTYITASSPEEAENIGQVLVNEGIVACVNIFPMMRSIYKWEGRVETSGETVLVAKTSETMFPKLENRVRELHSYSVPCIVALPITAGNDDFLKWIGDNVDR